MANVKVRSKKSRTRNNEERKMHRRLEKAQQFEEFEKEILPELRKMLKAGKSAPEIYEFAQSFAAARAVTVALTDTDSSRAMTAVKEILDRSQGRAKERTEVEHKFSKLQDNELDALLESRLRASVSSDSVKEEDGTDTERH